MLKIINAETQEKLELLSDKLYLSVIDSGFKPDLIIGIATGGMVVVDAMTLKGSTITMTIKKQRKGTKLKEKSKLLRLLPYFPTIVNDWLRRFEVHYREYSYNSKRWSHESDLIKLGSEEIKKIEKADCILVVDDTLDSGTTMKCILESITVHSKPASKIKSSVINQTFTESVVNVDYCLEKRTIIRFPWSLDVKRSS